jgi:hypothetical protein
MREPAAGPLEYSIRRRAEPRRAISQRGRHPGRQNVRSLCKRANLGMSYGTGCGPEREAAGHSVGRARTVDGVRFLFTSLAFMSCSISWREVALCAFSGLAAAHGVEQCR